MKHRNEPLKGFTADSNLLAALPDYADPRKYIPIEEAKPTYGELVEALKRIANTALWGEYIQNSDSREELRSEGLYNDEEGYQPSSDDENTLLRDCVEEARKALGLPLCVDLPESEATNG